MIPSVVLGSSLTASTAETNVMVIIGLAARNTLGSARHANATIKVLGLQLATFNLFGHGARCEFGSALAYF